MNEAPSYYEESILPEAKGEPPNRRGSFWRVSRCVALAILACLAEKTAGCGSQGVGATDAGHDEDPMADAKSPQDMRAEDTSDDFPDMIDGGDAPCDGTFRFIIRSPVDPLFGDPQQFLVLWDGVATRWEKLAQFRIGSTDGNPTPDWDEKGPPDNPLFTRLTDTKTGQRVAQVSFNPFSASYRGVTLPYTVACPPSGCAFPITEELHTCDPSDGKKKKTNLLADPPPGGHELQAFVVNDAKADYVCVVLPEDFPTDPPTDPFSFEGVPRTCFP